MELADVQTVQKTSCLATRSATLAAHSLRLSRVRVHSSPLACRPAHEHRLRVCSHITAMSGARPTSSSSAFDVGGVSYFENLLRDARGEVCAAASRALLPDAQQGCSAWDTETIANALQVSNSPAALASRSAFAALFLPEHSPRWRCSGRRTSGAQSPKSTTRTRLTVPLHSLACRSHQSHPTAPAKS